MAQKSTQFNINRYSKRYFKRHLDQYKVWENEIGKSIVNIFYVKSIIDLGCGVGSYLEGALMNGCKNILGIEISYDLAKEFFVEDIKKYIKYGDITTVLNLKKTFDCAMSFEVAEHIQPGGTDIFIKNLTDLSNKYIILTAAPPGQGGTGHINLREKSFWIKSVEDKGFAHQQQMVDHCVSIWKNYEPGYYILRNLMIFKKQ